MARGAVLVMVCLAAGMICASNAIILRPCHESLEDWRPNNPEIIDCINRLNTTWTAGINPALKNLKTLEEFRRLLGGLEENDTRSETDNKTTKQPPIIARKRRQVIALPTSYPASFNCIIAWPKCPSIKHIRNQGSCGSCWAVSVAGAVSDRTCICLNAARTPELSSKDVLFCSTGSFGCNGGYHSKAWKFWVDHGIVTGGEMGTNQGCKPYAINPPCQPTCRVGYPTPYWVDKDKEGVAYYKLSTINSIKRDIMLRGPLTTWYRIYTDFYQYTSGVYQYTTGSYVGNHIVRIIGWGKENGVPYWLCANQWGTGFGVNGFFKIRRGSNHVGIETYVWAGRCKGNQQLRLCGSIWYNPAIQGCCPGVPKRVYYLATHKCCPNHKVVKIWQICLLLCNGVSYNPIWQGCCLGRRVYNKITQKCCPLGVVVSKKQNCPRCIFIPYDPSWQGCCKTNCCNGKVYNLQTQKCCPNGLVVWIWQGCPLFCNKIPYNPLWQKCCKGKRIYNQFTQRCCSDGRVLWRWQTCRMLCNRVPYNPRTHGCCRGRRIYNRFIHKCCPTGQVVWIWKSCFVGPRCNGVPYNPLTHGCCRGRIYNKLTRKCCPNGQVIWRWQTCIVRPLCNGAPYNPATQGCCRGRTVYNKLTHKCCSNGRVLLKRQICTVGPLCGGKPYNPRSQSCCRGRTVYHRLTQKCCPNGRVIPKTQQCPLICGGKPYNPRTHACCRGRTVFNRFLQKCCPNGSIVLGVALCPNKCGPRLYYNPLTHICCRPNIRFRFYRIILRLLRC